MAQTFRPLALAAMALVLSACASEPDQPPPGGPGPGGPQSRLFISPAGQPFRGRPGEAPIERWWRQVDENGDGVVTADEFRQDFLNFFKSLDRNGDGQIDGSEVSLYENEIVPEIIPDVGPRGEDRQRAQSDPRRGAGGGGGRRRGGGGGGGGPPGGGGFGGGGFGGPQGAASFSLTQDPEPVMAADYDLSRRVSRAEWERRAREIFTLFDKDHDGKLTRAELPQPPQNDRAGRGRRR